jgi:hypothetical protein
MCGMGPVMMVLRRSWGFVFFALNFYLFYRLIEFLTQKEFAVPQERGGIIISGASSGIGHDAGDC